jgi:hypothetical protein
MHAHKVKIHIPSGGRRVSIDLPADFPSGEAEIIVLAEAIAVASTALTAAAKAFSQEMAQISSRLAATDFSNRLSTLLDRLPAAPVLPDLAFDRSSIYED